MSILNIDSKTFISQEEFVSSIQNNIIDFGMIKKFIQTKPSKLEILDIRLRNFIKNCNLISDMKQDEIPIDYLKRIYNIYYNSSKFNINLLKDNISWRFFTDILKFHSLILSKSIEINSEIIKMFINFLKGLYFDRDQGYDIQLLELSKPFETKNLDINTLFQNTPLQVNLITFLEKQREPDYKKRTDLVVIKKLLEIGKIFNLIGYNVIIVGSDLTINSNNQCIWTNTPYKFDEVYSNIIKCYPKLPFKVINIYVEVEFECM